MENRLRVIMAERNISGTEIYEATGIARSTISKIKRNRTSKIDLDVFEKLLDYLEITPNEFFGRGDAIDCSKKDGLGHRQNKTHFK